MVSTNFSAIFRSVIWKKMFFFMQLFRYFTEKYLQSLFPIRGTFALSSIFLFPVKYLQLSSPFRSCPVMRSLPYDAWYLPV